MRRAPLSAAWLPWAKASFLFRCHGMAPEQRQAMTTPSRCYCPCGVLHLRAVRHLRCFARMNCGSDAGTLDMLCTDCRLVRCYTGKKKKALISNRRTISQSSSPPHLVLQPVLFQVLARYFKMEAPEPLPPSPLQLDSKKNKKHGHLLVKPCRAHA